MIPEAINISEYSYQLPGSRIAQFPLERRDQSKLLVYRQGTISHHGFSDLGGLLPAGATLVFNNTKVIPARIFFTKTTGAGIEILLLNPVSPVEIYRAMATADSCVWRCFVGNKRKWKGGQTLIKELNIEGHKMLIHASWVDRENDFIEFNWENQQPFSEILEFVGNMPLPPYITRPSSDLDKQRYQTVYSQVEGAVAAPTAGLHFTDGHVDQLGASGFSIKFATLHVSAGTFLPIKTSNALDHPIHTETISLDRGLLEALSKIPVVIAVGTTSMRTLESVFWFGIKLMTKPNARFLISKVEPYHNRNEPLPPARDSIQRVLQYMDDNNLTVLTGDSEIFILPGYEFKICNGMITNFHLPGSTLLLLVAAYVGEDWTRIYQEALENDYRFLSYGDSSLLLPIGQG